MSKATGAALNVAIAASVGAARVASGNCFTWCDPHHVCNPRTGLCEPLPECSKCGRNQVCKKVGGVGMCVDAATEQYNVRQQMTDPSQPPVGVEPPAGPGPLYQPGPLPE
ncbi:MAG: hypothetical protein D6806_05845 [Deltaproteobacteria bacterium]|nr:MAG: hypothetical protein D6806_05845 [Deltaproteobacteria bacterium]